MMKGNGANGRQANGHSGRPVLPESKPRIRNILHVGFADQDEVARLQAKALKEPGFSEMRDGGAGKPDVAGEIQRLIDSLSVKYFPGEAMCLVHILDIDGKMLSVVDAFELWKFLEIKDLYRKWARRRVEGRGLEVGRDVFVDDPRCRAILPATSQMRNDLPDRGGHHAKQYVLTTDAARHITMMENVPRAHGMRCYYIDLDAGIREILQRHAVEGAVRASSGPLEAALGVAARETSESRLKIERIESELRVTLRQLEGKHPMGSPGGSFEPDAMVDLLRFMVFKGVVPEEKPRLALKVQALLLLRALKDPLWNSVE